MPYNPFSLELLKVILTPLLIPNHSIKPKIADNYGPTEKTVFTFSFRSAVTTQTIVNVSIYVYVHIYIVDFLYSYLGDYFIN